MDNKFHFERLLRGIQRSKIELPVILANTAQNFFVKSFTDQGWDGKPWQQVQRRIPGTPEYKYPKFKGLTRRTSPILKLTGRLRRAVSNSIKSATYQSVMLVVDVPGAAPINDGDDHMPQRRFMGNSPFLRQQHLLKIRSYMNKLWLE